MTACFHEPPKSHIKTPATRAKLVRSPKNKDRTIVATPAAVKIASIFNARGVNIEPPGNLFASHSIPMAKIAKKTAIQNGA